MLESGIASAAFGKLRDRLMPEVVEPEAFQSGLLRQVPPRCPPALPMPGEIKLIVFTGRENEMIRLTITKEFRPLP